VGGDTDLAATFTLHRLMISSRFMAMNSWSIEDFQSLLIVMVELGERLFQSAHIPLHRGKCRTAISF
jgi:hypothetical protein